MAGTVYLTAVGDTVHVASRFQDLTKHYQAQLIISEKVAARAGVDASAFPRHEITVRNRLEILAHPRDPRRRRPRRPGPRGRRLDPGEAVVTGVGYYN